MKSRKLSNPSQSSLGSKISAVATDTLLRNLEEIRLAITRRAYELFETRGHHHGHDLEDWFQAETELVRHVSFGVSESKNSVGLRASVHGFGESELKVAVEPRRIIIAGKKQATATPADQSMSRTRDLQPALALGVTGLPVDVDPSRATIQFKAGVLTFELPKAFAQSAAAGERAA